MGFLDGEQQLLLWDDSNSGETIFDNAVAGFYDLLEELGVNIGLLKKWAENYCEKHPRLGKKELERIEGIQKLILPKKFLEWLKDQSPEKVYAIQKYSVANFPLAFSGIPGVEVRGLSCFDETFGNQKLSLPYFERFRLPLTDDAREKVSTAIKERTMSSRYNFGAGGLGDIVGTGILLGVEGVCAPFWKAIDDPAGKMISGLTHYKLILTDLETYMTHFRNIAKILACQTDETIGSLTLEASIALGNP